MCGIVAIVSRSSHGCVDPEELTRIRDAMTSRGPDGHGHWLSDDQRVGLGHRRLSIIDLSEAGAQPMVVDNTVISYNGEIYNHEALRLELEANGHVFNSASDTEVLLRLYLEHGTDMLPKLRGMFAFALWDGRKKALLVARDTHGIKPLYTSDDGETVRVASQVKALLAGGAVSRQRDPAGVVGFFTLGSVPEPFTYYRAIKALPAGHYAWADERGMGAPQSFRKLASTFKTASDHRYSTSDDELQQVARNALLDSVTHHLVSDVPVGAFLSAGVDSGALVGLMRDAGQLDIQTVTLGFEEFRNHHWDEVPLAQRIAQRYGTQHTCQQTTQHELMGAMPAVLQAMDQPSIDGINTWLVSRVAHRKGLKVAISGLGGDELFGGYRSFLRVPWAVRLLQQPSKLPLGNAFRRFYELALRRRVHPKVGGLLHYGGSYPGAYLLDRGLFMPWELDDLLPHDLVAEGLEQLRPVELLAHAMDPDPGHPFARVALLEASLYMRNQLLRDTDWASMAHSLEVRVPLVDVPLTKALAPALIGKSGRRSADKRLLGSSPSLTLPDEVMSRDKTGFATPIARWIQDPHSGLDSWREVASLRDERCHWSRRLAYALDRHNAVT